MKIRLFLTVILSLLVLSSCFLLGPSSSGDLEVLVSPYKEDPNGYARIPFIHKDSVSAEVRILMPKGGGWSEYTRKTSDLGFDGQATSFYFKDVPEGTYLVRTTTFNPAGDVLSFGEREARVMEGLNSMYAPLGPAVTRFTVSDGTVTVPGVIDGLNITVNLPSANFDVVQWTAQTSGPSNELGDIFSYFRNSIFNDVFVEPASGTELTAAEEIRMFDLAQFTLAMGTPFDFTLITSGRDGSPASVKLGETEYHVSFQAVEPVVYHLVPDHVIAVDPNAPVGGTGRAWEDAYNDLQSAINEAEWNPDKWEIWVKAGTYHPNSWPNGGATMKEYHFSLRSGVWVYGGFAGGESSRDQRDFRRNQTILSGDFNDDDGYTGVGAAYSLTGNTENAYHVVYHPAGIWLTNSRLDGFLITGGNTAGAPVTYGGGIYSDSGDGSVIFANCVVTRNSSTYGGGMSIRENLTTPVLVNSVFAGNIAQLHGGGIFVGNTAAPQAVNIVFGGNTASIGGGVYYMNSSNGFLYNSTFTGNTGSGGASGGYSADSEPLMANNIFWSNQNSPYYFSMNLKVLMNYSVFEAGYLDGSPISTADPLLQVTDYSAAGFLDDLKGPDGFWMTEDDGYLIQSGSSAVNWGNNASLPQDWADMDNDGDFGEPLPVDILGNPRILGGTVDAGVNERE